MNSSQNVKLTRRGRIVLILLPLLIVAAATIMVIGSANALAQGQEQTQQTVIVKNGDTLWSIAAQIDSPKSTHEIIHDIKNNNNVTSGYLEPGQRLKLPVTK